MKIFSRFHYVWYLVSVSKGVGGGATLLCVCVFMHATACPWLLIEKVCVSASLAGVNSLVCVP